MIDWKNKVLAVFASKGEKEEVPLEAKDQANKVTFETGYTINYEKDAVDVDGTPIAPPYGIERTKFNYLFNLVTAALKEVQETLPIDTIDNKVKVDIANIITATNTFAALESVLCIDNTTNKPTRITKDDLVQNLHPDINLSDNNITVTEIAQQAMNNFLTIDNDIVKKADKMLQEVIEEINLSKSNIVVSASGTADNVARVVVTNADNKIISTDKFNQEIINNINLSKNNVSIEHKHNSSKTLKPIFSDENGIIKTEDGVPVELIEGDIYSKGFKTTVMTEEEFPNGIDDLRHTDIYSLVSMEEYKDVFNNSLPPKRKAYLEKVLNQIFKSIGYTKENLPDLDLKVFTDLIYCPSYQIQVIGISQGDTDNTKIVQTFILFNQVLGTREGTLRLDNAQFQPAKRVSGLSYTPKGINTAINTFLGLNDKQEVIRVEKIDLNAYSEIKEDAVYTAVQTLIVEDKDGIKRLTSTDFIADYSKSQVVNIVYVNSGISSYLELPLGYSLLMTRLSDEPTGITNADGYKFLVLKYERKVSGQPNSLYYIVYKSVNGLFDMVIPSAHGVVSRDVDTQSDKITWYLTNLSLDLSEKTVGVSAVEKYENISDILTLKNHQVKKVPIDEVIPKFSKDIKYNIIADDNPITSVKDLPEGYNVLEKTLTEEPNEVRNIGTPLIHRYKRNVLGKEETYFVVYASGVGGVENINIYCTGSLNDTGDIEWNYTEKYIDLSVSTAVSKTSKYTELNEIVGTKDGIVVKTSIDEVIPKLSINSIDIKYTLIGNDDSITDVKDLPYGYFILQKKLINEPTGLRNDDMGIIPFIHNRNGTFFAYVSNGNYPFISPSFIGELDALTSTITWKTVPVLDISQGTLATKAGTYANSDNVLMSSNTGLGIVSVPKTEFKSSIDLGSNGNTGVLPVSKGGTGVNSLVGIKTAWTSDEFFNLLGLTKPVHTNEIVTKINTLYKNTKGYFVLPFVWQNDISNLPDNYGGMLIVFIGNNNNGRITYYSPHTFAEYLAKCKDNQNADFIKVRNEDGSIPAEIGGTPFAYKNDTGYWIETKLSNGRTMLEGIVRMTSHDSLRGFSLPKKCSECAVNVTVANITPDFDRVVVPIAKFEQVTSTVYFGAVVPPYGYTPNIELQLTVVAITA